MQFLSSEKSIRIKSLIDVGYTVKDIKHLMNDKNEKGVQVEDILELVGEISLDKVILTSSVLKHGQVNLFMLSMSCH